MSRLTKAAIRMLQEAGFSEVADDYVIHGATDIRILLCRRAIDDLNHQARADATEAQADEYREKTA